MPKAKARKRGKARSGSTPGTPDIALANNAGRSEANAKPRAQQRSKSQGLIMSGMVALGCWGMAISFIFFTADPNRYVYGGIAVLMALMWSSMFGVRLRKSMRQR